MPLSSPSPTLAHNEVLNFIKDFRSSVPHNSELKQCLEKAFRISDLEEAKDTLFNLYSNADAPGHKGRGKASKFEHLILWIYRNIK